jgi:hypothetical protein
MNRIFGRVLVRETNVGIPNLVVAAFDSDVGEERRQVPVVDPNTTMFDRLGNRIGSTLTDSKGDFVFDFADVEFQNPEAAQGGRLPRPDILLAVFAPEDTMSIDEPFPEPPEKRILHFTKLPRVDAGLTEAFVIRLMQKQLSKLGIPEPGSPDAEIQSRMLDISRFASSVESGWILRDRLREQIGARVRQEAAKAKKISDTAKEKLKELTARRPETRGKGLFVPWLGSTENAQKSAIEKGLNRIQRVTRSFTMSLSEDELENLNLKFGEGATEAEVSSEVLLKFMMARYGNMDLVRIRDIGEEVVFPKKLKPQAVQGPEPAIHAGNGNGQLALAEKQQLELEILKSLSQQVSETNSADLPQLLDRIRIEADKAAAERTALAERLGALNLKKGPADTTAYHDFHVLQIAFEHVWTEAFDEKLRQQVEQLYGEAVQISQDLGVDFLLDETVKDVQAINDLIAKMGTGFAGMSGHVQLAPVSPIVASVFPQIPASLWAMLSLEQQLAVEGKAAIVVNSSNTQDKEAAKDAVQAIINHPGGTWGRVRKLLLGIGQCLAEPYAFDVFAPGSFNFGIMLTYRQKWEPGDYQAGDLISTIPLAPGEVRRYSKKQIVRKSRAEKEVEKSLSSRAEEMSQTLRAEAEIMNKVATATNFKLSSHGSFNIGIADIGVSSDFSTSQDQQSSDHKKNFMEATRKAAEEYKRERTLEVDTTSAEETENSTSGEISNPNNEITVTYLFYELQRQFKITESIHRARPVILVAQDVPRPHEIDEAWLIAHEWILKRVLLDDGLRPALGYLTAGLPGDEVSIEVVKAHWEKRETY